MAAKHFTYFLIVLFVKQTNSLAVHMPVPEIHEEGFTIKSHFKYHSVLEYCMHRNEACRSNNSNVCAVKLYKGKKLYKDFKNGCFLFLNNMCDHPEDEYFIVTSGSCGEYLASRRSIDAITTTEVTEELDNSTETNVDDTSNESDHDNTTVTSNETESDALRQGTRTTLYTIDTSYDFHMCPHSCADLYSPVCVNVNRGFGKYFKMLTFVNHCESDVYYCKHWAEFLPPPNEDESVRSSPLAWSFCGAYRFLQFARFSEVTSSMSHYGWLSGNQRYSRILEPHERQPGYG